MSAVADDDEGRKAQTVTPEEQETQDREEQRQIDVKLTIVSSNGKVNVRVGNGTSFKRITAVKNGTKLQYIASAVNGWHAVLIGSQVGWVSGEYSRID